MSLPWDPLSRTLVERGRLTRRYTAVARSCRAAACRGQCRRKCATVSEVAPQAHRRPVRLNLASVELSWHQPMRSLVASMLLRRSPSLRGMEVTKENQSQKKEGKQVDRQDEELDAEHGRVNVMLGRGATFQRTAPTDTSPCHLDMSDHVVEYPEHLENLCPDDEAYTQEDTNADRFHKDGGDTPIQQPQTDWRPLADAAATITDPMYNTRTGATHGQQHQTDFASGTDAAANVHNPLHTSTTGDTPIQQPQTDWRPLADAAATITNPMYNTRTGPTHGQQHQTDWRSLADAAATISNPMYNTRTGATHEQQHQTDWRSLADAAATISNPMYNTRTGTFCGRVQDAVRDFPRESAGRPPGECDTFCGRVRYVLREPDILLFSVGTTQVGGQ
ncbi:hypothetical protein Bbelb_084370 [Branchiostoma belcheri]|nr:hypothetical protein Bbelb_084370 [Branchiostoma belcheri]